MADMVSLAIRQCPCHSSKQLPGVGDRPWPHQIGVVLLHRVKQVGSSPAVMLYEEGHKVLFPVDAAVDLTQETLQTSLCWPGDFKCIRSWHPRVQDLQNLGTVRRSMIELPVPSSLPRTAALPRYAMESFP